AINHGGMAADYAINARERGFRTFQDNYIVKMREKFYTVSISPFGERHSSFWFYNGFREMYNTGKGGSERADEVVPIALDWLNRKGKENNWYLHINVWDPHTPYQVPESEGNPFQNSPPPSWMTEDIRLKTWNNYGPGSARDPGGNYGLNNYYKKFPRMVNEINSIEAYKKWIDGYDCGIFYADKMIGMVLNKLKELGIYDDTLIMISSDHGENQGELSVYGDHQTADHITNRVPMIVRHPKGIGGKGRVDSALYYQFDIAATFLELSGINVPESWDGKSFFEDFKNEKSSGRDYLVISNCAWSCQRSVRWEDWIMIKSYHTGLKNYPEKMLFNLKEDPHELLNLAEKFPEKVDYALARLEEWTANEMKRSHRDVDPLWTVIREGGPFHASFKSPIYEDYLKRLKETNREWALGELEKRKKEIYF
ncbi:MAG TPA: sulfatase-like hydrolase/transferase, partial [Victivallales bacterium]|nr:sulfatase-like hydrolase/transferase [Victivallales bacterium]